MRLRMKPRDGPPEGGGIKRRASAKVNSTAHTTSGPDAAGAWFLPKEEADPCGGAALSLSEEANCGDGAALGDDRRRRRANRRGRQRAPRPAFSPGNEGSVPRGRS